jgi:hypothetical protein
MNYYGEGILYLNPGNPALDMLLAAAGENPPGS